MKQMWENWWTLPITDLMGSGMWFWGATTHSEKNRLCSDQSVACKGRSFSLLGCKGILVLQHHGDHTEVPFYSIFFSSVRIQIYCCLAHLSGGLDSFHDAQVGQQPSPQKTQRQLPVDLRCIIDSIGMSQSVTMEEVRGWTALCTLFRDEDLCCVEIPVMLDHLQVI